MAKLIYQLSLILIFSLELRANSIKILIVGDSLTAGYGVKEEDSYPQLLQKMIDKEYIDVKIIADGISGSISSGARSRLDKKIKHSNKNNTKIDILILALGANDGLRGLTLKNLKKNLEDTITLANKNKIKVILAGMEIPENYGKNHANNFKKIYTEIKKEKQIDLIPFLLEGVAGNKDLNLDDKIHPNEKGYKIVAKNVFKFLKDKGYLKNAKKNNSIKKTQ